VAVIGMAKRNWSKYVMETSNALDLDKGIFKSNSARKIAESLRASAETSKRRKSTAFGSAMSMLNFYINRAGVNLSAPRKTILEKAKNELRKLYGKPQWE
jgi:hypothetical protein